MAKQITYGERLAPGHPARRGLPGRRGVKVVRLALQNAASVASLLLTTEASVSQIPAANADTSLAGDGEGMY